MGILKNVSPTVAAVIVSSVLSAGGGAYAASQITSAQIKDGTIQTQDLANGSVTSNKVADGTLRTRDLSADAKKWL
ncbi:MAG: hypothetical protein FWD95_17825, partial [Nocardioidaceae bacterium]|nr:hypothetical protein [Nocardioidaceae bacterium]